MRIAGGLRSVAPAHAGGGRCPGGDARGFLGILSYCPIVRQCDKRKVHAPRNRSQKPAGARCACPAGVAGAPLAGRGVRPAAQPPGGRPVQPHLAAHARAGRAARVARQAGPPGRAAAFCARHRARVRGVAGAAGQRGAGAAGAPVLRRRVGDRCRLLPDGLCAGPGVARRLAAGHEPAERTALHDEAHRVLAALHRVDWRARGLQDFGRTEAYFERLIARWTRQYRASQTCELPAMERLIEWLPAHIPASARDPGALALLHGDFRLENMVFHPSEPRVLAVLDWELATLGHPLSDLAYHAMAWHHPPGPLQGLAGLDLAALGIPTEQAFVARYLARMGRDDLAAVQADWPFYLACNLFRLCAILQGIARRVQDGTAASPIAREVSAQAGAVAERGWGLVSDW